MRRTSIAIAVGVLLAGAVVTDAQAQARATTGIGEARRVVRRAEPPRGLSTTGINIPEEERLRAERLERCRYQRRGYYDAYGRVYGYGGYDGYERYGDYVVHVDGGRANRTYAAGDRFNRDGRYDPNGRYDRDGRLLLVVPPGTQTTATTGTIMTTRTATGATYAAPRAAARVETARSAAGRVAITSAPIYGDARYDNGCGYVDRGYDYR